MKKRELLAGIIAFCAADGADAAAMVLGQDRFTLTLGSFLPSFDTQVQVAGDDLGPGDDVDVESDLGVERTDSSIYASADWRFLPRHRIFVSYFESSRENRIVAQDEIQIGDEIYPAGASLNTKILFNFLPVSYAYTLKQTSRYELAVTGGLYWNAIELDINGNASLGGEDADARAHARADAPMPLVGLLYDYAITSHWLAGARGELFWFELSGGSLEYAGTITNLRLSTDYWFGRHFAIGAAVNAFRFNVDVDSDDWQGTLDYGYVGPQVYLNLRY